MIHLKDILINKDISIDENISLERAIKVMYKNHQGVVVAVSNNYPIGIITQKDVLNLLNKSADFSTLIKDTFTFENVITVNSRRSVEYAIHILINNDIKRAIVVDDSGYFLGIVAQDMLIKSLEDDSFRTNLLISSFINHSTKLICLNQNDSIHHAFQTMSQYNIGSIIAVDDSSKPIGILTQKDAIYIANIKKDQNLPISQVMSSPIICVEENDIVKDVINLMTSEKINQVLVLNGDKEPILTLSMRDITRNLKGNYGHILESKLKNIKKTLNYIGESVLEVYEDNNELVIQWMNDTAMEKFGKVVDTNIFSIFNPKAWDEIYSEIKDKTNCKKFKINTNNMYFELTCSYHFVNNKETLLLVLRDISKFEYAIMDANKRSIELQNELKILQNVIDQQNNMVFVTNGVNIISTNKSFFNFFNVSNVEEFTDKYKCLSDLFIPHHDFYSLKDNSKNWVKELYTLYEKDKIVSIIDAKTIEPKVFTVQLNKLNYDDDNYVVTLTDITEIKLESQKYYFNATHDALTKIYNRAYYLDSIKIALDKVKRYESTFSIILLDIDNFKKLNDTYGHVKGDEVLVKLANVINHNVRVSDVFARWGGEEFIVLLPEADVEKAELLAENLRRTVSNMEIDGAEKITASFGVTQFHEYDNENTITRRADEALYEAKNNGRDQVVSK